VTGLGLLVGVPSGFRETAVLASAGMAVLAAAGFAAITLTGARPVPGLDDLAVTGFGFTLGGLALMPLAQLAGGMGFRPTPAAIGLLVALGTGPTAVAYTLYFRGLRSAAASTAALLALLEPLTGAILAALVLGEQLSVTGMAGAAIIGAAVIVAVRADRGTALRNPEHMADGAARVGGDAQPLPPAQQLAQDREADHRQGRFDEHNDGLAETPAIGRARKRHPFFSRMSVRDGNLILTARIKRASASSGTEPRQGMPRLRGEASGMPGRRTANLQRDRRSRLESPSLRAAEDAKKMPK